MIGVSNGRNSLMGIVIDFVDSDLNKFLLLNIAAYSNLKTGNMTCGYACSDHASWTRAGYKASFPFECTPGVSCVQSRGHTENDLVQYLDTIRAIEFIKFSLGFTIELSS